MAARRTAEMCSQEQNKRDRRYSSRRKNRRHYGYQPDADNRTMNETLLRPTQPTSQIEDDDILDGWLATLSTDDLDRFLNGLSEREYGATVLVDLPA